jgi:hypothetical protein
MATDTAGATAILSSVPLSAATELVRVAADHLGLTDEQVEHILALRRKQRQGVYESDSTQTGRQFACAVAGTRLALTLHLPDRWSNSALVRKARRALNVAATEGEHSSRSTSRRRPISRGLGADPSGEGDRSFLVVEYRSDFTSDQPRLGEPEPGCRTVPRIRPACGAGAECCVARHARGASVAEIAV